MRLTFARAGLALLAPMLFTACPGITGEGGGGAAEYVGYRAATCAASASPLPGFRTCSVIVAVTITKALSTGTVSVFFNYPDAGSFYHGELSGLSGFTGTKEITLTNSYVSSCPKVNSDVDIYDGAQNSSSAKLILNVPRAFIGPLC